MFRAAVYCTREAYIGDIFGYLQEYQRQNSESHLKFSLFCKLENMESAICNEAPFDLYIICVENGNSALLNYVRAIYNMPGTQEIIFLFSSEENMLQVHLDCPKASRVLLNEKGKVIESISMAVERLQKKVVIPKTLNVKTPGGVVKLYFNQIIYIEYRQKRLVFFLDDGKTVITNSIRVPMEEYVAPLMQDRRFIRTHSGFLVNIEKVIKKNKDSFLMEEGSVVPIAKQRRKEVLAAWKRVVCYDLSGNNNLNAAIRYCESHSAQLEFIRKQPFPQCIIRVDVDKSGKPYDFVFVFVNNLLCELEGKSREEMLGLSFYKIFLNGDSKWLFNYWDTAYNGSSHIFDGYSAEIGKNINVICYQVSLGYCGCILHEIDKGEIRDRI